MTHADDTRSLALQIQPLVDVCVPPTAPLLVVNKGDNRLLEFSARRGWHFPHADDGSYLGYHPADSAEAIARLEQSRARGAEYLVVPRPSLWWLDHYTEFRVYLNAHCRLVGHEPNVCAIYALRPVKLAAGSRPKRVVALLATRNEERFIGGCIKYLVNEGVQVYLIDNQSTDRTVEIAEQWLRRGLIGIESTPFDGTFNLPAQLERKEQLAASLDGDWFIHLDADEIKSSPQPGMTLAEAFAAVEEAGYNAVDFEEFTFVPTRETPDHDHADYARTMRWYYPFVPRSPWRINAWQRQSGSVNLRWAGGLGHRVTFPGMRLCPIKFPMRHYMFLSVEHACRKYGPRKQNMAAIAAGRYAGPRGWHNHWTPQPFPLPSASELCEVREGEPLDASRPRTRHYMAGIAASLQAQHGG